MGKGEVSAEQLKLKQLSPTMKVYAINDIALIYLFHFNYLFKELILSFRELFLSHSKMPREIF